MDIFEEASDQLEVPIQQITLDPTPPNSPVRQRQPVEPLNPPDVQHVEPQHDAVANRPPPRVDRSRSRSRSPPPNPNENSKYIVIAYQQNANHAKK